MSEASRKPNLDVEKLRSDKLKSVETDLMSVELEERRRRREETKKAIIAKINANNAIDEKEEKNKQVNENKKAAKPKYVSSVKEKKVKEKKVKEILKSGDKARKEHPQIKILPTTKKTASKIKDHSERLSYTMQMDVFSKDKIQKYRQARKNLNVQDKFVNLENTISKLYLSVVVFLSLLIIINILVINVYLK